MPEPNISTFGKFFVRWRWICCTTSCRIVVSSSVGGVVQHVRSRCPCTGVWHLILTALVGGRGYGTERFVSGLRLARSPRRRRCHFAEAVRRQRAHMTVIADDRDADRSRGDARATRVITRPGRSLRAARTAPRSSADHVVVGTDGSRRRRSARSLQPVRQPLTPRRRQPRRRRRHLAGNSAAAALQHSLVFALQYTYISLSKAVITIFAIRLWYDCDTTTTYGARLLSFDAIRREQTMNMSIFRRSRVVVVSQPNRNCDIGLSMTYMNTPYDWSRGGAWPKRGAPNPVYLSSWKLVFLIKYLKK